jgi:hypothetical protein
MSVVTWRLRLITLASVVVGLLALALAGGADYID